MFRDKSGRTVRREAYHWSMRMRGDDAAAHRESFEQWRTADQRHRDAYARLEQQWAQAALLRQTSIGRSRALPQRRPNRMSAPYGYAMAVSAIILAIGVGFWLRASGMPAGHHAAGQFASRVGEIQTLTLADGSLVTLDTDSVVQIVYSPGERRIELRRGRARFDVMHNPDRPFVVSAGTGTVVARGTIFDVSLIGDRVNVSLLRGVVDVCEHVGSKSRSRRGTVVQLHQGQSAAFTMSRPLTLPRLTAPTESTWVSGMLSFDSDRLGDVIAQANRYSKTKISVNDPALNQLKITGAYHVRDASTFAQTIAASLNLNAVSQSNGNIILSRPD